MPRTYNKTGKFSIISHATILSQSNRECVKNLTMKNGNNTIKDKKI